jgi:dolichol-phosphate mannosyltransferase
MDETISIIVPTYNEKDNILPLVERLHRTLSGHNYEILIVDDNSKDGTVDIASGLSSQYPVKVLVRLKEKGLATAVLHGFQYAKGDIIGVMDADLQHPPEVNAELVKAIENGADMAIASRYVKGGGCPNWGLARKIISRGAMTIAHVMLPSIRKVHDPMSGFFMFKREGLNNVEFKPIGYKILMEILVMGKFQNVVEVPFIFEDRSSGRSKMKARQQIDYLKHIYSLMRRTGELKRFIKFIAVGLSGVVVNEGILALTTIFTTWSKYVAEIPGIEISIITNFTLNDFFTFADRRAGKNRSFISRLLRYNGVSLAGVAINIAIYSLISGLFGMDSLSGRLFANFVGIVIAFLWNYFVNSVWTWK